MTAVQGTDELLRRVGELIRSERLNDAAEILRAASEGEPTNGVLLVTLGDVLARMGRTIPARRYYQRALERDAGDGVARVQLARLLAHLGDTAQAIEQYRQAIAWRADTAPAYIELAALLAERGDQAGAIEVLSRLTERQPDSTDALLALGVSLMNAARWSEAEDCFRKATAVSPQNVECLVRLGVSLREQDRFEEARIALREALRVAPQCADAAHPLANLHWTLGQYDQALGVLREFLTQNPFDFGVHHDLARRLDHVGRHGEAHQHYESALALAPQSEEVITALGLHELREGDQTRGWLSVWLTARRGLLADNAAAAASSDLELPRDLGGKAVLLLADGGLGNELFILRYVAHLKARGAKVYYQASAESHLLLRQRPNGLDGIISSRDALPPCDHTLFVSALPWALSRADSTLLSDGQRAQSVNRRTMPVARRVFWPELPASLRLEANAARLKFWRERLADMGAAPYTAITWRLGASPEAAVPRDAMPATAREVPLDAMGRIIAASPGTLVSIQHATQPDDLDRLSAIAGRKVHDASRANSDIEDVLALLALADEYVCVSNAYIHLRAAVGNSAKVLVPWPPDWRWRATGAESPWFPEFRLYRQQPDGNWTGAVTELAGDIASEHNS